MRGRFLQAEGMREESDRNGVRDGEKGMVGEPVQEQRWKAEWRGNRRASRPSDVRA